MAGHHVDGEHNEWGLPNDSHDHIEDVPEKVVVFLIKYVSFIDIKYEVGKIPRIVKSLSHVCLLFQKYITIDFHAK